MSVRAGREFLAIPGPTTVPDEVLRAMHRPAVDIYSGPLVQLTDSLLSDLSRLFRTQGRSYIYIANGHGAWEAALTNVLSKGDKILVLESGRFAVGWGDAAAGLGDVTIQARKTYVSLVSPRRTFARVQPTTKNRVDLGLRLDGEKPGGRLQPSKIHETMRLQISFTTRDEVDSEALDWLQRAYDQNR